MTTNGNDPRLLELNAMYLNEMAQRDGTNSSEL